MKTLAIIPCYNEEGSIEKTILSLKEKAPDIDYVIINDGSVDNTKQVCEEKGFNTIDLPFNLGLANAVQTGMLYAYKNNYEQAIQFDGDGQHLPEYISDMQKLMLDKRADIIIGSRYMKKYPFGLRGLGQLILRFVIRISTGNTITDPTSGMRLVNRKMIERFATEMNHGPEPDTLVYLIKHEGAVVLETPVTMQERKTGKSYFGGFTTVRYMAQMVVSILLIQWFRAGVENT